MEVLSPEELRVLGCLLEKERTTPEAYPMTLNGLIQACNQKTSRDPVVSYDAEIVENALEALNARGLANWVHQAGARVRKFRHAAVSHFELYEPAEQAVFTVLLLRGPQTVGEIRQRTERMHAFPTLESVEIVIRGLTERDPPLVFQCPRIPGRKEIRFMHNLGGGLPDVSNDEIHGSGNSGESTPASPAALPAAWRQAMDEQAEAFRGELDHLRGEVQELREAFDKFRREFE